MKSDSKFLLFIAVIQALDAENAEIALTNIGYTVSRLPSTGGFLGRRNATLLVGTTADIQDPMYKTIEENCRQRVEYIAVPMESAPLPLPTPTPITVGGATIFSIEVEHFEVI